MRALIDLFLDTMNHQKWNVKYRVFCLRVLLTGGGSYFQMCSQHIDYKRALLGSADPLLGHPAQTILFPSRKDLTGRSPKWGPDRRADRPQVSASWGPDPHCSGRGCHRPIGREHGDHRGPHPMRVRAWPPALQGTRPRHHSCHWPAATFQAKTMTWVTVCPHRGLWWQDVTPSALGTFLLRRVQQEYFIRQSARQVQAAVGQSFLVA